MSRRVQPGEESVPPGLGTLLVAPRSGEADALFEKAVVLVVDREPSSVVGLALNRPLEHRAIEESALAALVLPDPQAAAMWGGPMGKRLAILAEVTSEEGLEWFHLPTRHRRPFPLPGLALIALGEHLDAFKDRVKRARLYVGMCVWTPAQLDAEIGRGDWLATRVSLDDVFHAEPERQWEEALERAE